MGDPISAGNLDRVIPDLQKTYMGGGGGGGDPMSAGNLDGVRDLISTGEKKIGDPIPAGNLDGGIPNLREARRGIPYLQEN